MKVQKKKCPMCGEEFPYIDIRNVPSTCGTKMCVINYKYQQSNITPEGKTRTSESIKKWES